MGVSIEIELNSRQGEMNTESCTDKNLVIDSRFYIKDDVTASNPSVRGQECANCWKKEFQRSVQERKTMNFSFSHFVLHLHIEQRKTRRNGMENGKMENGKHHQQRAFKAENSDLKAPLHLHVLMENTNII